MIKKFYYNASVEYYIYYTVNDGNPVELDPYGTWPGLIRNEMITNTDGRLVFSNIPTYIPDGAFAQTGTGNYNLVSISLPNTITNIGNSAFLDCSNLSSFTLDDSVTVVGDGILEGTAIGYPVYNSTIFAYLPRSYSGSYTIPNGITTIIGYACWGCDSLTSIYIPDSVTEIGYEAFNRCDNLTRVEIGYGITNIGKYAFLSLGANGTFICRAIDPPNIDTSLGSPGTGWILYVPANSVSTYQADQKWASSFSDIRAIP